jgi:hypothetical protein
MTEVDRVPTPQLPESQREQNDESGCADPPEDSDGWSLSRLDHAPGDGLAEADETLARHHAQQ